MSQPQPAPWGGVSPDPARPAPGGHPAPGAIPGQPAAYPVPGQHPGAYVAPGAYQAPGQHPAPGAYPEQAGHPAPGAYPAQAGAPAPGAIPAPYSGQPVPGQPPAPQPGYPPQGVLSCRFCGSVPAAQAKFRGHQGMLVVMRFLSSEGPFCRSCGLSVFRQMTSKTLVQGWYGYASFIITPITVLMNLARHGRVANLAEPRPNPYGPSRPPMDPGPRLLERPMTWIGLVIPVALISLIIYAATQG
ncbi:hypothetical protein [Actinoplanes siamensis]|uniref:Uncharacterized protein n=1 Tax=Actinoplanes siamensis TaxID=1223317 RepID=A0A919N5K3_9ACTN|nr:hypothetical protein [Actinoplanes siamensis]GIF04805.1 hypothetical protein Asi03nite_23430 [Actinoplanes siamensis]